MNRSDQVFATICSWDRKDPEKSLDLMYQCALDDGQGVVKWYTVKRRWKRIFATALRGAAIVIGAVGGLMPVLDAAWPTALEFRFGAIGFVLIAVAAAIIGFDKFFGFSSGWIRFMSTQLAVERAIKELQYDWAILQLAASSPVTPDRANSMLSRLRQFEATLATLVEQETLAWATEFHHSLAEFEAILTANRRESPRAGIVNAMVTNGADFKEITLKIDDAQVHVLKGATARAFSLDAGAHTLSALAERNGVTYVGHASFVSVPQGVDVKIDLKPMPRVPPDGPMFDGIIWNDTVSDDQDVLVRP